MTTPTMWRREGVIHSIDSNDRNSEVAGTRTGSQRLLEDVLILEHGYNTGQIQLLQVPRLQRRLGLDKLCFYYSILLFPEYSPIILHYSQNVITSITL